MAYHRLFFFIISSQFNFKLKKHAWDSNPDPLSYQLLFGPKHNIYAHNFHDFYLIYLIWYYTRYLSVKFVIELWNKKLKINEFFKKGDRLDLFRESIVPPPWWRNPFPEWRRCIWKLFPVWVSFPAKLCWRPRRRGPPSRWWVSSSPLVRRTWNRFRTGSVQCDQIGLFLKHLGRNFSCKSGQIFGDFLGNFKTL